jgi:choline-sulfatase
VKPLRREPSDEGSDRRLYQQRIKTTPTAEEVELYNVTTDPMELDNLTGKAGWKECEAALRQLLAEQCAKKRLTPSSGAVPGETACRDA